MRGFPLGDLFNWWPAKYTTWLHNQLRNTRRFPIGLITALLSMFPNSTPKSLQILRFLKNYPNPFNPTTEISYSVPKNGYVTLKVFDLIGREVATLYDGVQSAGNHIATFNAGKFSSGVYFYRLQSGGNSITKKLILMK